MATFRCISAELAGLLTLLAAAAALAADVFTVDGKTLHGDLSGKPAAIHFASSGASVPLPDIALIRMRPYGGPVAMVSGVVTADGSTLRGAVRIAAGGAITLHSPRLGKLSFPPDSIHSLFIDLGKPFEAAQRGVLFRNGDFLAAETIALGASSLQTESALGKIDVPLDRVAAVYFAPSAPSAAPAEAVVVLDNGDTLNCSLAGVGDKIALAAPFGRLEVEERFVTEVVFARRCAFVSDLVLAVSTRGFAPEGLKYASVDTCLDGPLKGQSGYRRKGLVERAGAAVEAELPSGARHLFATPEIAAGASPPAGRFSIERDGREIWAQDVEAGAPPAQLSVDLGGARRITFLYQSKPEGLVGSSGLWGDAFVTFDGGESGRK